MINVWQGSFEHGQGTREDARRGTLQGAQRVTHRNDNEYGYEEVHLIGTQLVSKKYPLTRTR